MQLFSLDFENPWIASADGATRRSYGWAATGIGALVIGGPIIASRYLPLLIPGQTWVAVAEQRLIDYLAVFGPMLLVAGGAILIERRKARRGINPVLGLGVGLIAAASAFTAAMMITAAAGVIHTVPVTPTPTSAIAVGTGFIAFQSVSEEVVFRGWLQPVLAARWGAWIGLLVTAAGFSAAHLLARPFGTMGILGNFLGGLFFGALALRTGGLAAPAAAHFAWNALEQSVVGLTPNPGVDALGSILNWDMVGPELWTGGVNELNGALGAVISLTLGSIVLLMDDVRRDATGRPATAPSRSRAGPPRIGAPRLLRGKSKDRPARR